jgi:parvulin-like peptidyl-prolyl isomerase
LNHTLLLRGGQSLALAVCLWGAPLRTTLAQYDQYPATDEPRYQAPQPTQGYGPSYEQQYASPYDNPSAPPNNYGPYDDYRQQNEIQPNFAPQNQPAPPQREPFKPGERIAIVGSEWILAGDLLGDINQMLKPYEGKVPEEEIEKQRMALMQRMLPQSIQTKILYQEFMGTVPKEAKPEIENKLAQTFDDEQLPDLIDRAKVNTAGELDAKLREFGSSIDKQRRLFAEQVLAREFIRQNINREPEVSHEEMVAYYKKHYKDYERPARVRWEELAVNFSDYGSKAEAYRAIAAMGNRVLRGAAFSRVAREESKGVTASDGGWYDWTTRGSLRATVLDEAIFALPVDELSQIIETDDGFHIIRVLDREDEGRSPFFKEQVRIKAKIQSEKRDQDVDAFIAKVRRKYRVWTIFDDAVAQSSDESGTP